VREREADVRVRDLRVPTSKGREGGKGQGRGERKGREKRGDGKG